MLALSISALGKGAVRGPLLFGECPERLASISLDQIAPFAIQDPPIGVSMAAALACTRHAVCNHSVRVPG